MAVQFNVVKNRFQRIQGTDDNFTTSFKTGTFSLIILAHCSLLNKGEKQKQKKSQSRPAAALCSQTP